ncbi:MAG: hypothetical protein K8S23_08280, partial [Candidatus Cloacimonetes bacterium]|nr:hypothetical protein [Candidatus Cloacimonadota bacterium]
RFQRFTYFKPPVRLEVIDLFKPYYDLTKEEKDFWKTFIPNKQFYKILRETLSSIDSTLHKDRLSLWMQGTYGTGKSFATAVIKSLLYNELEDISEFVEKIKDEQLKIRLTKFRKDNIVFPVILKGTGEIRDNTTFSLEIEKAVKKALDRQKITISTQTDFDRMIDIIEKNPLHMNWNKIIQDNIELKMYVSNTEELLGKLKQFDKTLLLKLEELSSKTEIHFSHTKIDEWLIQVLDELKKQNIANKLIIYWDEFTSILEMQNSSLLLSKLQDIAELSSLNGIYLFIISHRTPEQAQLSTKDMKKVLGRFHSFEYVMEPITNYHLIGAAIKKKNIEQWNILKNECFDNLQKPISVISEREGFAISDMIRDLFPIHPYTAYLSTFVSRNIGSSERSIFKFLYDNKKGFLHFIKKNPSNFGEKLLSAEYLFDFFFEDFKNSDKQKYLPMIIRFNLFKTKVESQSKKYFKVFKSVLLLNVLYRYVDNVELIKPNEKIIKLIFTATTIYNEVEQALIYLHKNQIVSKNPDGLFLIESSALPVEEISKSRDRLLESYKSINKILDTEQKQNIKLSLTSTILRDNKLEIFDVNDNVHILKNKIKKTFKDSYKIHIALFISMDYSELENIRISIKEILSDDSFSNIIFVIANEVFDNETFNKFIDYQAQAHVAGNHNMKEELDMNLGYAKKVISQWVTKFSTGSIDWYLAINNDEILNNKFKILFYYFSNIVNQDLMNKIFSYGINTLKNTLGNKNIWDSKMSKAVTENFLFSDTIDILEQKTKSNPAKLTREILKDENRNYIVKPENLVLKYGINHNHPIKIMSTKVREVINRRKGEVFNLGNILIFLTKPPFGIYPNMIHSATVAFLLRDYVGKLFEAGTGRPLEKEVMRDKVINLFEYWTNKKNSQKLEVRLGTIEEKEMILELCNIFEIEKKDSLNDVKWAIRNWIKEKPQLPLWIFSHKKDISENIQTAINLITMLLDSIDTKFSHDEVKETLEIISRVNFDLNRLFQDYTDAKPIFIYWLKTIENVSIEDNEEEEVIEFIRQSMPEEVGVDAWKEENVVSKVKDWNNEKLRKLITQSRVDSVILSENTPVFSETIRVDIKSFNHKIDEFNGDLKLILKRIGSEHKEIISIIEKYLI